MIDCVDIKTVVCVTNRCKVERVPSSVYGAIHKFTFLTAETPVISVNVSNIYRVLDAIADHLGCTIAFNGCTMTVTDLTLPQ